ncbi:hypothetical protein EDD11_007430 [Mortierella claussenii]|nr:hypothetical protein EDD11_007430 [Mortierella claussenii]
MFRLVNKRLAANRELESLKQQFNQCSLPIEFVYRIVVSCVDEIMTRGLNHPFILKNPYPASVVAAMVTLMADPDRRDLFSLKCMRIDTVAGVMLAVLKNLREAIVPMEIQDELTSAVNRALLMELLNLSLAILNRSSFNHIKPDMLASILGPHIFATQHATILQHTPQQAYSFGWGVALVNDIKRCSKMFYVLLGGYRREILGSEDWEYEQALVSDATLDMTVSGPTLSASLSRGSVSRWLGSTATIHGGISSAGFEPEEDRGPYFSSNHRQRLRQSVPQLNVDSDSGSTLGGHRMPRSLPRYGMVRSVSTTISESIRATAAQEAKHWEMDGSMSGSKGPAALQHLRGAQQNDSARAFPRDSSNGGWTSRQQHRQSKQLSNSQGAFTVEQRQQELFQQRFKNREGDERDGTDELSSAFRRHKIQDESFSDAKRQREEKRLEIERMIRECRGTGLNFETRESEPLEARS